MKHTIFSIFCLMSAMTLRALSFSNLNDGAYLSGPKLTDKDLAGRVIAVEVWGYQCPPCLASLSHIAKLAKSYENDSRVEIIGSHVQDRNDSGILAALQKNDCTYPVYQWFGVDGAPSAPGLPFAYVMSPKGEILWQGNPYSKFGEFQKAIETAISKMVKLPKDSLLVGLELNHCKDVAKRLVIGQNIEPVLNQLQTRIKRGGAAAEEATAIVEQCEAWAAEQETAIRDTMETRPSIALMTAQRYAKTMPKHAATVKEEMATLAKNPLAARLATSRNNLVKLAQTKATTPNAKKQLLSKAKMQQRQLTTLSPDEVNEDLEDVKALWDNYVKSLEVGQ